MPDANEMRSLQYAAENWVPRKENGEPVQASTVFRWYQTGIAGVRLETVQYGRRIYTSRAMVEAFGRRVAEARASRSAEVQLETGAAS